MEPTSFAEMLRQMRDPGAEWDAFTKFNAVLFSLLRVLPGTEEKRLRVFEQIRAVIDRNPEHIQTALDLAGIIVHALVGDSIAIHPNWDNRITVEVDVTIDEYYPGQKTFRVLGSSIRTARDQAANHPQPQDPAATTRSPDGPKRIPKKYKPYLKYDEDAMDLAWSNSELDNSRHYATSDHLRLYLTRPALVEMYKQPARLKYLYASILKKFDAEASNPGASYLRQRAFGEVYESPLPAPKNPRFTPYMEYTEDQMRLARRAFAIHKAGTQLSYGYLSISLSREAVFKFYKRIPEVRPVVEWMLRYYDEHSTQSRRHDR